MPRDPECDLCRNGVVPTPYAVRAYMKEHGCRSDPPRHERAIRKHLERFAGRCERVFTFLGESPVPIVIHVVPPARDRPYQVLLTAGMSELPMQPPPGVGPDLCWAELAILLPPEWRLTRKALRQGRWYWPVRLLLEIIDQVHRDDAWVWCGHTYGTGERVAFDPSVPFTDVLLHHSGLLDPGFEDLDAGGGKTIHILSLWPIHREERELCERLGSDDLIRRLVDAGATDVLDPKRESIVA